MLYAVHKISIIRARIRARIMHIPGQNVWGVIDSWQSRRDPGGRFNQPTNHIVGVVRAYAHKKINMHTRVYIIVYIAYIILLLL